MNWLTGACLISRVAAKLMHGHINATDTAEIASTRWNRRDNPFHLVLAISAVSVAFMCPCMSFAATLLIKHAPVSQFIPTWLQTTVMNFPMAFFWQIFYAGPFVRFVFGKLFPEKERAAASAE